MDGAKRSLAIAIVLIAGCQAPPTAAPPTAVIPVPQPVAPAAAPPTPTAPPTDPRAVAAAKLAAQQAKSIQELLDAKAAGDAGVPVIEPARQAAPPVPQPTPTPVPAPVPKPTPPVDQFHPVPPLDTANLATPAESPAASPAPTDAPHPAAYGADVADNDLSRLAREHPRDLVPQLDEQLAKFVKGEQVPSAESLAGLGAEDRDVLTGVLDGLSNFRTAVQKDPNLLVTKKIQPLIDMADRLRSKADLTIINLNLCKTVSGFGNFTPLPSLRLVRGVDYKASVYYEIENVSPRLDDKNMYVTTLRQDIVLYDSNGQMKWNLPALPVVDRCRNRRRDFFLAKALSLPTNLEPGAYVLKVTLSDLIAGRVSEGSLTITIVNAGNGGGNGGGVENQAVPLLP